LARAERAGTGLRLASALALGPPALACAWLGGPWLAALVIAAAAGMGWEWARLTGQRRAITTAAVVLAAAFPSVAMAWGQGRAAFGMAILGAAAVLVAAWGRAAVWAASGTAWIALPCAASLWLDRAGGPASVLWLFVTVWATDTGAYAAGKGFGGPRLAPRLSPNKTWAGFAGGLIAAAVASWGVAWLAGAAPAALVPAGLAIGLAAQGGDLAESLAKRRFGVKDSGRLIPGHGGLLDRLDGMLAAAAMEWALTYAAGVSPLSWPG
jgi:phosphatidate cytidylyltransferase